jgi:hypothetical protein
VPAATAGVKSGTSILEDVLLVQLNQLATQLHTLAVCDQEAASLLVGLAGKLNKQHFQQLQVSECAGSALDTSVPTLSASPLCNALRVHHQRVYCQRCWQHGSVQAGFALTVVTVGGIYEATCSRHCSYTARKLQDS